MKTFLLSQIQEGKYFQLGAYLDEDYMVLTPETPVGKHLLDRLARWDYEYLSSDGEITDGPTQPGVEGDVELVNLNGQFKEKEELEAARKEYLGMIEFTEKIFTQFVTRGDLPHGLISNRIKEFIEVIKKNRTYMLRYREFNVKINYIVMHSVISTIIGIVIGQELRLPPHKLIELGTTCLLHEIGMIKLPSQLYMTDKILTEQERRAISAHTALGFKILKGHDYPMAVNLGVLESHENIDGSGYPRQLTGERISLYAKIVSVASSYAAMSSNRPFRRALDGHSAILEILKSRGKRYDEAVLAGLVRALSVYPIGTYVQIQNGSKGMVVQTFTEDPRNPLVKLLVGPKGEKFMENPVVNTTGSDYKIVGVIAPNKATDLSTILNAG